MQFLLGARRALPLMAINTAVLLLTPGIFLGVWRWPTAWMFLAVFGACSAVGSGLLAVLRPASYQVRRQGFVAAPDKQQPLIDTLGLFVYAAWMLCWFVAIPLDVFRFKLLPPPPPIVQVLGAAIALSGLAIAHVAIGQNRFAAPTIHDQSADSQQVIQSGLYGLVRHPFYAGMLLTYPGIALWLGSYAAALASVGFLIFTLARIAIEERFLRENLAGYDVYAQRVRGRLIPGVL